LGRPQHAFVVAQNTADGLADRESARLSIPLAYFVRFALLPATASG
jgi:hypothetical protein